MEKTRLSARALRWADCAIAGVIMLIAAAMMITAYGYSLGSIRNIGPGMMPFLIGLSLLIAAGFALLRSRRDTFQMAGVPVFRAGAVIGGVVLWGLTIDRLGLVPATVILMLMASLAYGPMRWRSTLIAIAGTTIGCVLVFIYGFKLPFDIVSW